MFMDLYIFYTYTQLHTSTHIHLLTLSLSLHARVRTCARASNLHIYLCMCKQSACYWLLDCWHVSWVVRLFVRKYELECVCMYVRVHVCMYACMYVCMCMCMCICIYIYIHFSGEWYTPEALFFEYFAYFRVDFTSFLTCVLLQLLQRRSENYSDHHCHCSVLPYILLCFAHVFFVMPRVAGPVTCCCYGCWY